MYASTSHELKTPLNAIINCINCLDNKIDKSSNLKKWVTMTKVSAEFLLNIVNDSLDYT